MSFILLLFGAMAASGPADLAVVNARIYTGDPARPRASALAVRAGRIVAAGQNISAYIGPATRHIDARGATILPGFIDSHCHMANLGAAMEMLDLRSAASTEAVAGMVRKEAAARKPGEWILGRGWDQTRWSGSFPTEALISAAAPANPVYLSRVDGHAAWVNRRALDVAGLKASTPDPEGGRILRDSSGQPTGVLIDKAQDLITGKIPPPSAEQIRRRLEQAALACSRLGITSVHDAGVDAEEIAVYRRLLSEKKLPVRVYAMIGGAGPLWDEWRERGPEVGEWLTIRSIKLLADGALGSRGAALLEPYSDEAGNRGLLILDRGQIAQTARHAVERGFQVNTHAIGDGANREALAAYASVLGGKNDRRFRIEHAQVIAPEDFEFFAKYSVVASIQATHATSDMRWAEARLGPERAKGAYAWRRFLSLDVPVANGSDFPVEEPDPLRGFYAAVTRQDDLGRPDGGWFPEHRMSREEALRSWTVNGAYAAFEENIKGSLAPGKLADFVMLSTDIMTAPPREILKARVLMTVVGGEIRYTP